MHLEVDVFYTVDEHHTKHSRKWIICVVVNLSDKLYGNNCVVSLTFLCDELCLQLTWGYSKTARNSNH